MTVNVNGNNGNDTLSMGNGNIGLSLRGPVSMNGGAGTDTGFYTNTFDNTPINSGSQRHEPHRERHYALVHRLGGAAIE
jgi:hypothetical protein